MKIIRIFVGNAIFLSSFFLLLSPSSSFFLAGPHLSALDRNEPRQISHLPALDRSGPRWTSSASLDHSGPCRTSSVSSWSRWISPDLHCFRSPWASPDLNRRKSERCGSRRTSTGEIRLDGPHSARFGTLWASPDLNRRNSAQRGPRRTLTGPQRPQTKPYRMPKRIPNRMPNKISEDRR